MLGNVHYITRHLNSVFRGCFSRSVNALFHSSVGSQEEALPYEWYRNKLSVLTKLTRALKDIDLVDGKLEDINGVIVYDDAIKQKMQAFKSLARIFVGSPSLQQKLKQQERRLLFGTESEREPLVVNSLTKVCNFLDISAQQRKLVRCTVCSQVTQQRIWRGALEDVLNNLKEEVDWLLEHSEEKKTQGVKLGQQVILSCLKFLSESSVSYEAESSTSWMRPVPARYAKANASAKWEDVLDIVNDLRRYLLEHDFYHLEKLLSMKEGLLQIKDVFLDNTIGFREVRHQEHLVHRKLSKMLGSPSPCLFTLLVYFLYGRVRDIEVDLCGGFYKEEKRELFCLSMGRILTSADEKMVRRGVKQLDRALGLFEFVWETAGMKETLDLHGHLWCLGAEEKTITYRGKTFYLHDLCL
ncbi:hypothetical protein BRARA_F02745 [Brassica rapa]|uniref:Uncharacterized protein n=1 Tax=Brassica campestris TaxID=3711 RepID=A0A397Z1F1_BRACM|nr:hypothetical protein BRARA_F02745 [Brassica rapa]